MRRLLPLLALLAACSDSDPLSDAIALQCPAPGALPFRLSSSGFRTAVNATLTADNPRIKDEASDTLGNPAGPAASVYLPDAQASAAAVTYQGRKARTTPTAGLTSKPIAGETVSLWSYDPAGASWKSVGQTTTATDGSYELAGAGFVAASGQPVYAVLEADGSCAEHVDQLLAPGSKVVVTDIDGTLTTDDLQILMQASDDTYVPKMMTAGDQLIKAWAAKGYAIVYLTARPHNLRAESRGWLEALGFPAGAMITTNGGTTADVYKTVWLRRMIQTFGWTIVAAYGNADTDIVAYADAGIAKDHTFIVGPLAGSMGTQPIASMDFTAHISSYVAAQPSSP